MTVPQWMSDAMRALMESNPHDRFEFTLRKGAVTPEWRIKCLDCPGKVSCHVSLVPFFF